MEPMGFAHVLCRMYAGTCMRQRVPYHPARRIWQASASVRSQTFRAKEAECFGGSITWKARSMLNVPPMVDYKRVKSRERGPSRSRVHDDVHALRHKPL